MAQRRMISLKIIDTDSFLDMPVSARELYLQFSMRADDDGFVGNPKRIVKMVGASDDDMNILIIKKYIIPFETGVCVVSHWHIHNYIQKDRYTPTQFKQEMKLLDTDKNEKYLVKNGEWTSRGYKVDTKCVQNGYNSDTQVSIELGEDRERKENICNFSEKNCDKNISLNISENKKKENKKTILISSENEESQNSDLEIIPDNNDRPAVAKKSTIFSFSEKLSKMQNDKRRNIQIIALYWIFKGFEYTNEKQYTSAIGRDVKAGSKLSGYSDEQITKTMQWLEKNAINYVWKLETVHKYIDEKGGEEVPFESSSVNSSEDEEAYLMNEGNPQYKTFDIPWNELPEEERNRFLENEAIRKKYANAPFSPKEINFKEFAKDFSVKKTATLTKEDIKKIPLIDF